MTPEAYDAPISDYEFRLYATMCLIQARDGVVEATVEELRVRTHKSSDKTVRRALTALEEAGFLTRIPTKKARGHRGRDRWLIVDKNVHMELSTMDKNVHTTHGNQMTNSYDNQPSQLLPIDSQVSNKEDTSYLLNSDGVRRKEIRVPIGKYDDGDDLAGFGLIEPRDAPQPKIKKNDPKTRGKRPHSEWTPMDVASEFSFLVGRKYPWLPGTVNVFTLSRALAKYRTQYGTSALIELEILRLFMGDESNFRSIGNEAPHLYKTYLAMFRTHMNQARQNLGLDLLKAQVEEQTTAKALAASDGREFQNSISGRAQLERHEQRLRGNKND
jgi:hypothetical protein